LKEGLVWNEMTTNLSQLTCQFQNHYWEPNKLYLPNVKEMNDYLESYINKHKIKEFHEIKFNAIVNKIDHKIDQNGIEYVEIHVNNSILRYRNVIICTGCHNKPIIPSGLESFKGKIIHSSEIKTVKNYSNYKNVLIVGFSYTGTNLCEHFVNFNNSKRVTMSYNTPSFLLDVKPLNTNLNERTTYDFEYFSRIGVNDNTDIYLNEDIYEKIFTSFYGKLKEKLEITNNELKDYNINLPYPDKSSRLKLAFNNSFLERMKEGRILIRPLIKNIYENSITENDSCSNDTSSSVIEFEDGNKDNYDLIILCTGYRNNLKNILSEKIQKILDVNEESYMNPFTACKCMFSNELKGLFFIGLHPNMYFISSEIEANYISRMITGKIKYPENYSSLMECEKKMKNLNKKLPSLFLYSNYCNNLANNIGIMPDYEKLKEEDLEFYELLKKIPITIFNYSIHELENIDPNSKVNDKRVVKKTIYYDEIKEYVKKVVGLIYSKSNDELEKEKVEITKF
jgi:dimethylaniline monooxygenase (N-oxide forming)